MVCIVLVRPIYARNIGSVSRAMGNLGGDQLVLINPQCELDLSAREGAAGCQKFLEEAEVYPNLDDFFKNHERGLRISFSRRCGKNRKVSSWSEKAKSLFSEKEALSKQIPIYLFFGPEDSGLSEEDNENVHHVCSLPVYGDFASFNLSHAVQLALFIFQSHTPEIGSETVSAKEEVLPVSLPDEVLRQWIEAIGFDLSHDRVNAYTVLRKMILRSCPNDKEVRILNSALRQTLSRIDC